MPPFIPPFQIISGFKEKVDSLLVQGDRLYIGTATGNLHIYSLDDSPGEGDDVASLVEVKKSLGRRAIEQLGFIKDINSLVVLSESTVTLYPLPTFSPPTPLAQAKAAFSFGIHSYVEHVAPPEPGSEAQGGSFAKSQTIPTLVTKLVVGCRRKVVIYTWKDGESQEVKEAPLPHSARVITFFDHDALCFAYSTTEFAIFSISTMTATDVSIPLPTTAAAPGMSAFTGFGGYMTLGLGAKAKPGVAQVNDKEALIVKDNEGIFIGTDAKQSRTSSIEWSAPPEEIAFVKPYIFSVLPPGATTPHETDAQTPPKSIVQLHSAISSLPPQTVPFPFHSDVSPHNTTVRLMTPSPSSKSPLFLVTTSADKITATAEGSSIWQVSMKPWAEQIDEFVEVGQYADALALLNTLDQAVLPDKAERLAQIRVLNAVSQFRASKFDDAIDTFIDLDLNPAKIVALYPDVIAGRLAVPQDQWIPLFGGPVPRVFPDSSSSSSSGKSSPKPQGSHERLPTAVPAVDIPDSASILSGTGTGSLRGRLRTGLGAFMASAYNKDDDTRSTQGSPSPVAAVRKKKPLRDELHRSVETLVRYLTDRRPKVEAALATVGITPANQSHDGTSLSETSLEELWALPNAPLAQLTPEQLLRFAQLIDTALFKSYLVIRPSLLGSLCRVANWCEVTEVEEELRARQKFGELKDLYNGKKMHKKALDLLRQLSEQEDDLEDKLLPSIWYLQKLGPEYLDQIFDTSRWIFERDRNMAFDIFTSEEVELPRSSVANFLESIDPALCARYLEHLIEERKEGAPVFHDRLAELYVKMTLAERRRGDTHAQEEAYAKLLKFIDETDRYSVDRLYGLISSEDLYEARAMLLGRLRRHDQALELYVYRLQDYLKAEEYCKRYYEPGTDTSNVFLTLLRIYLRPSIKTDLDLLHPALDLISRHSPRIDAVETLNLLPPLVTAQDVRTFLLEALRAPIFDTRVCRQISKARGDQVSRTLMMLQSKRVKVTDSRICPQCHKRLGNSVIVVHSPRGEVTHYQCREAFSRRLQETRY